MAKNTYKQDEVLEEPFDIRHLLRASSYIKKYAGRMVVAILLSGIGGAFGYVAPMIIQRALDLAIPDKNEKLLFSLVGMLVGIYVVSVIFTTIRSRIMVNVSQNIIYDIRKDLFEHLQELPFQYYDDRPHGKILIRVVNYVNSVSDMLSNGLINIVLECFNLLSFSCSWSMCRWRSSFSAACRCCACSWSGSRINRDGHGRQFQIRTRT